MSSLLQGGADIVVSTVAKLNRLKFFGTPKHQDVNARVFTLSMYFLGLDQICRALSNIVFFS